MKFADIEKLILLLKKHKLNEIQLESKNSKLILKNYQTIEQDIDNREIHNKKTNNKSNSNNNKIDKNETTITSPVVGNFYRANTPNGKPFVNIGDKISPGTIVCIIEAMKIMNEIKAEQSGIVKNILVEDAQPVEYGQPMFIIEQ